MFLTVQFPVRNYQILQTISRLFSQIYRFKALTTLSILIYIKKHSFKRDRSL